MQREGGRDGSTAKAARRLMRGQQTGVTLYTYDIIPTTHAFQAPCNSFSFLALTKAP